MDTDDARMTTHSAAVPAPGDPTPTPPIDDGLVKSLDPRSVTVSRIAGGIFAGILTLVLVGGATVPVVVATTPAWGVALLYGVTGSVSAAVMWLTFAWPAVSHRHTSYTVSHASIEIRRGVFWRKVVSVPRSRVQHTDVSQGPLERRFGLGTIVIYTAGTEHSKVDLHGLAHETASRIRDHLLPIEEDDAV
ncbi:MAG: PH domain-containing protein [Gemmatimonadota bacterium]